MNLTWLRQALSIRLRRGDDERGQGMVEYALILVLIAIVEFSPDQGRSQKRPVPSL